MCIFVREDNDSSVIVERFRKLASQNHDWHLAGEALFIADEYFFMMKTTT